MGGGKKHKRGSIPSSLSSASKTEFIERTPENDYGVLSDPEENGPSSPVPFLTGDEAPAAAPTLKEGVSYPTDSKQEQEQEQEQELVQSADADSHSPSEQSATLHVSPHSSPSLQPQHQSSQSQISQDQSSNSLNALKLKLTTDKNYSKKITLHTFFSYIILAIEIECASSSSSSIAHISAHNIEKLVEYMIETHTATDDIKTYLRTLGEFDVIKYLISAVIDFNKDQPDHTLDKLLLSEQIELEMTVLNDATDADDAAATTPIMVIETAPSRNAPQTPHSTGFFKRLRRFFSGCCG